MKKHASASLRNMFVYVFVYGCACVEFSFDKAGEATPTREVV